MTIMITFLLKVDRQKNEKNEILQPKVLKKKKKKAQEVNHKFVSMIHI